MVMTEPFTSNCPLSEQFKSGREEDKFTFSLNHPIEEFSQVVAGCVGILKLRKLNIERSNTTLIVTIGFKIY